MQRLYLSMLPLHQKRLTIVVVVVVVVAAVSIVVPVVIAAATTPRPPLCQLAPCKSANEHMLKFQAAQQPNHPHRSPSCDGCRSAEACVSTCRPVQV